MNYLFYLYNKFPLNNSFDLDTNQAVNNTITSSGMKTEVGSPIEECIDDSNSMNDINKSFSEDIDKIKGQEDNSEIAYSRSEIDILKSTQSEIIDEKDESEEIYLMNYPKEKSKKKKSILFETYGGKKRGRAKINNKGKIHDGSAFDNLQTKIQVHFFTFIVNISNDALKTEFGKNIKYNFKNISYEIKKKVNYKVCDEYKNSSIKVILGNEISSKYKCHNKNNNIEIVNDVCKRSNWLNEFFNLNYLNLFEFYYNDEEELKKIPFKGKDIILSNKTKSFYDLLEKNKVIKNDLIETVKRVYFNRYDNLKHSFKTIKNEIENNN